MKAFKLLALTSCFYLRQEAELHNGTIQKVKDCFSMSTLISAPVITGMYL